MPKRGEKDGEVCGFIQKLWDILQNPAFAKILLWNNGGKSFAITNPSLLESYILPKYFRHSKLKSFVRQLNMYGFKKSQRDKELLVFFNHNFKRNQQEKLCLVRRKLAKRLQREQSINETNHWMADSQIPNHSPQKGSIIRKSPSSKEIAHTERMNEHSESKREVLQIKSYGRLIEDCPDLIPFISPFSYASIKSEQKMGAEEEGIQSLMDLDLFKNGSTSAEEAWGCGFTSCQYFV